MDARHVSRYRHEENGGRPGDAPANLAMPTSRLTVYQEDPLNAGTPLECVPQAFVTPSDLFFIRGHGTTPQVAPETYRLVVKGMVQHPLELSLEDLLTRFPQHTLTATLVCAGSRREELAAIHPMPGEILWNADPISTARWRGVRLGDVLRTAGVEEEARYVAFRGLDQARVADELIYFGSSIRLEKALTPEVLLVHEMNDTPLPREHGFPLRVLVPGYVGARSVKWLQEITLQSQPSTNYFQARDYKTFPPTVTAETAHWEQGKTLEEIVLNAVICTPKSGETLQAGSVLVQGYALRGEEAPVERVELSTDRGATWKPATIREKAGRWAWCFWETTLDLPVGECQIIARAWDAAGKTQPEDVRSLWNFKGYANNAWHQVQVSLT